MCCSGRLRHLPLAFQRIVVLTTPMAWLESIKRTIERTREGWRHWRTFREIDEGHRYQSRYHFPPAPPQERPGISIPEALQPRLRPHTHNRRLRIYPNAGPELHHHRHRALAARRRVPTPRPSLRQGRCEAGKTGTVDQRRVERHARRGEGPGRPYLRRHVGIRSLQAVRRVDRSDPLPSRLAV